MISLILENTESGRLKVDAQNWGQPYEGKAPEVDVSETWYWKLNIIIEVANIMVTTRTIGRGYTGGHG